MFLIGKLIVIGVLLTNSVQSDDSKCDRRQTEVDSASKSQLKLLKYLNAGIPDVFWQNVLTDYDLREFNVSSNCDRAIRRTIDALKSGNLWAFRIVDASGKSPPGLLDGTFASLGDYDECLSVKVKGVKNETGFEGQYCMLKVRPKDEIQRGDSTQYGFVDLEWADNEQHVFNRVTRFRLTPDYLAYHNGFCMPSACSTSETEILVSEYLRPTAWELESVAYCTSKTSKKFTLSKLNRTETMAFLWVSTFIILVLSATLAELLNISLPIVPKSFVKCFSAVSNFKELITRREEDNKRVRIADYCRLTIIFVEVAIHANCFSGLFKASYLLGRIDDMTVSATKLLNQGFTSTAPNESLFFLGGATAAMSLIPLLGRKNVPVECVKSLVKRWFRLAPVMLCCIALQIVIPYTDSGPAFDDIMQQQSEACQKRWWHNLLFFQHLLHPQKLCLPYTWSISAEFQLYALGVFNIYLLYKWRRVGICFTICAILAGMIIPAVYAHIYDLSPFILFPANFRQLESNFSHLYLSTSSHLTSYFMMFLVFYLKFSGVPSTFSKPIRRKATIALLFVSLQVILWNAPWNSLNAPKNRLLFSLYLFSYRFLITLWPVWLCFISRDVDRLFHKGKDTNENVVKSQQDLTVSTDPKRTKKYPLGLLILTRLAGSIYMMHYFFINWDQLPAREVMPLKENAMVKRAIFAEFGAVCLAVVFYLFFDAPIANLRQMFTKNTSKKHAD